MSRTPQTHQEFRAEALAHAEAWQEDLDHLRRQLADARQWMDVAVAIHPDLRSMVPSVTAAVKNGGQRHANHL